MGDYERIVARIRELMYIPRPAGCRKLEGTVNDYRIRISD